MNVWRANPIPTQLSAGIAALLATAAVAFVPQAYPAQLMGVAGVRASALPSQQRGLNPALIPASAPQFDPSLLSGQASAIRAAAAFSKPPAMPTQSYPIEPELLDWYEADAAIGIGGIQEGVWAGYRTPTVPAQLQPLNPSLIPQVAPSTPPTPAPYPYAAIGRASGYLPQGGTAYNPAFDGPYNVPPLTPPQPSARSAQAHPTQANGLNPALIPSAQISAPPSALPYPYASLVKAPAWTQSPAVFNPAITLPPDAPPITSAASLFAALWRPVPMPVQTPIGIGAALLPPLPVDAPPLTQPYPYSGTWRFNPHPIQPPIFAAALAPPFVPPPVVTGFTDVYDSGKKRKPFHSIYSIQEKADQEYRALAKTIKEEAKEEIAEAVAEVIKPLPPAIQKAVEAAIEAAPLAEFAEYAPPSEEAQDAAAPQAIETAPAIHPDLLPGGARGVEIQPIEESQPHDEADDLEAIQAILHSLGLA